jgi:hypothetical protein
VSRFGGLGFIVIVIVWESLYTRTTLTTGRYCIALHCIGLTFDVDLGIGW